MYLITGWKVLGTGLPTFWCWNLELLFSILLSRNRDTAVESNGNGDVSVPDAIIRMENFSRISRGILHF